MSVINPDVKLKGLAKQDNNDRFTLFQAIGLIMLTLFLSVGGWYAVGKYFFWTNLDMKRVNQQLLYYQAKVQSEPKNLGNRVALGYTYYLTGNNDQASKEFNQILAMDKKFAPAYYNLGLVYEDEDRLDDAMEMYQKSIELSPRDYKGHLQKGIVYRKMKMYKEAIKSLEAANKLMPGRSNLIFEIGRVAEDQGQLKTARAIFKEALLYDPLYKDAVDALKRVDKKL